MQLLIHRATALALLEDEQKFKLGGVDGHYFPFLPSTSWEQNQLYTMFHTYFTYF
jgi:hypothetical protein